MLINWLFNKRIQPYQERIKSLEKQVEIITGENNILKEELKRAQGKEDGLLQKIFELTGINQRQIQIQHTRTDPESFISMGKRGIPWATVREKLERDALTKYWEDKANKAEKENEVGQLELEKDASRLS